MSRRFLAPGIGEFSSLEKWRKAAAQHHDHVIEQEHTRYFAYHSGQSHSHEHQVGYFYCNQCHETGRQLDSGFGRLTPPHMIRRS